MIQFNKTVRRPSNPKMRMISSKLLVGSKHSTLIRAPWLTILIMKFQAVATILTTKYKEDLKVKSPTKILYGKIKNLSKLRNFKILKSQIRTPRLLFEKVLRTKGCPLKESLRQQEGQRPWSSPLITTRLSLILHRIQALMLKMVEKLLIKGALRNQPKPRSRWTRKVFKKPYAMNARRCCRTFKTKFSMMNWAFCLVNSNLWVPFPLKLVRLFTAVRPL